MVGLVPLDLYVVDPAWTDRVPSPAHDSMSTADRRKHLERCPDSYLAVTRSLEDLPDDVEMTVIELLEEGRAALERLLAKGAFGPLRRPAMYAYRLDNGDHVQTGLLCGTATADFSGGSIRAHERVFGAQRDHLAKHFEIVGMQSSPIVMAHDDDPLIEEILAAATQHEPLLDFTSEDGLRQMLWAIDDDAGARSAELLADEPCYIIDGHHRTGAADLYLSVVGPGPADHMLTAVFPASQMRTHAFHRWLRTEDDCRWLFDGVAEHFESRQMGDAGADEAAEDELAIYHDGMWTAIRLPVLPEGDALSELDAVRLQRHLLGPLVGIDDSAPRSRLDYLAGDRDLDGLVEIIDTTGGALVMMRPVGMHELFAVADAGQIMPPKSTYFMPKARSGVVLRPLA